MSNESFAPPPAPSASPEPGLGPVNHQERLTDRVRLTALNDSELMDSPAEAAFDRLTRLAAKLLGVPLALVSLVDDHRQFFKSAVGLPEPWASRRETPLTHSFCQYGVTSAEPLVVIDAREHPWLKDNLAISELGVIAYAGMPLFTEQDQVLGMFCGVDSVPRAWTAEQIDTLRELASMVATEIELRARVRALREAEKAREDDRTLLRSVLDCMADSVVVTAPNGDIILANQAARAGRSNSALRTSTTIASDGIFLADGVTPLGVAAAPSTRALSGSIVTDTELIRRIPGEPDQIHNVNAAPIRDAWGAIIAAVSVGRDVTKAKQAQQALERNEALLRTVVQNLPNGAVLLFDMDLRYLMADGEQLLFSMGLTTRDLVGKTPYDVVAPERAEAVAARYRKTLQGSTEEFEVVRGDRTYQATVVPVHHECGVIIAGMALVYEVTAHKKIQEQLREAERMAREEADSVELLQAIAEAANSAKSVPAAFQACLDCVCAFMSWPVGHVYQVQGNLLKSSTWWHDDDPVRFAGFRAQSAAMEFARGVGMIGEVLSSGLATWLSDLTDPSKFVRAESAALAGLTSGFAFPVLIEDEVVAVLEFYSPRREEADFRLLSMMANIGTQLGRVVERERARKLAEDAAENMRSQSIRDELTNLFNRRGFMDLGRQRLQTAQREDRPALLFFVDLNKMKQINDELGHDEGDRALIDTADVLRETFRSGDIVARLGGDEFVALLLDAQVAQIEVFASRIRRAMSARNAEGKRRYRLSASVGAAAFDASKHETIEALLVKADSLMYEQKRARHGGLLLSMLPPPSPPGQGDGREPSGRGA
ncbi:MAG: diguanylate cyclase [Myxococcales bacterium]